MKRSRIAFFGALLGAALMMTTTAQAVGSDPSPVATDETQQFFSLQTTLDAVTVTSMTRDQACANPAVLIDDDSGTVTRIVAYAADACASELISPSLVSLIRQNKIRPPEHLVKNE